MTEEQISLLTRIMCEDDLKTLASSMGYNIIKRRESVKFVPCKICGGTRHSHYLTSYHDNNGNRYNGTGLQCLRCGIMIKGKTETDAKHNWNAYMNGFELPEYSVFKDYMKKEYKDEND